MAIEKKLDCVILGLLAHEELTGYEIKNRIDKSLKYFWNASFGSIYPTLNQLVENKLATKRCVKDGNRQKNIYTITKEGKNHLQVWLRQPVVKDELRYETLLKVFFGNEAGAKQTIVQIKSFKQKIEDELPYLLFAKENLEKHMNQDKTHQYYLLTVIFGIQTYQGYIKWCNEAIKILGKE